jgi:hypothetical protein
MLLSALKLLRYSLGNPVSRQILSLGLSFCDDCKMTRLEHAMMIYPGKDELTLSHVEFTHPC